MRRRPKKLKKKAQKQAVRNKEQEKKMIIWAVAITALLMLLSYLVMKNTM